MDITVSSRQVPVSDSLRATVDEKISKLGRFLDGMERAEVHFAEQRNRRMPDAEVCEVTLHGHGHHVRAKVSGPDSFAALDAAVVKLEHQLRTLKSKLVSRHQGRRRPGSELDAALQPTSEGGGAATGRAGDRGGDGDGDEALERFPLLARVADEALVVKTKRFSLKPMTPDEAILQMELLSHRFFFFTNAHTGLSSVIYRRDDGDFGLIEPAR